MSLWVLCEADLNRNTLTVLKILASGRASGAKMLGKEGGHLPRSCMCIYIYRPVLLTELKKELDLKCYMGQSTLVDAVKVGIPFIGGAG